MTNTITLSKLRVLLVDDESFVRRVTATMLKSIGLDKVYEAENGRKAIEFIKSHEIDLLITDIQMPEMNGIELVKQIRLEKTPTNRNLRIIVVTSFAYTEVLGSCLLLDVNGFLVKPISAASAMEKIQFALKEQLNLHPIEAYSQVKTDLAVLEAKSKEERKRQNAAIVLDTSDTSGVSANAQPTRTSAPGLMIAIGNLKPGMELLEDVYANTGVKLLPKGRVLTEVLVNRIRELRSVIDQREVRVRPKQ